MKTITELRDYLLENYVDDIGDLDISCLDFSDFDGDVITNGMKVKRNLHQDYQYVKGDLWQGNQNVGGDLAQDCQKVEGNLRQSYNTVKGNYYCEGIKVGGDIYIDEPKKLLKEITSEELAKMGYVVVDDE